MCICRINSLIAGPYSEYSFSYVLERFITILGEGLTTLPREIHPSKFEYLFLFKNQKSKLLLSDSTFSSQLSSSAPRGLLGGGGGVEKNRKNICGQGCKGIREWQMNKCTTLNYPLCRLKLVVEKFENST